MDTNKLYFVGVVALMAVGCASGYGNGSYYNQETRDTYSMMVGGSVADPEYTFQRGAFEICKANGFSGVEVLKKEWKKGGYASTWIDGRVRCDGKTDPTLQDKFKNRSEIFVENTADIHDYQKEFHLKKSASAENDTTHRSRN